MKKKIVMLTCCIGIMTFIISGCGNENKESNAWICAKHVVEEELKSPSTAKFCSYPDAKITDMGDNRYKVEGYVDAKNSFGAEIRTDFTVTLTLTKSGYKDESCSFDSDSIDSESGDMKDFISDYIDEHPEEYSQTDESDYDTQHTCEVSECYKDGTYSIVGISGETEYYCYDHYQEIQDIINMMEEDVGSGAASKHQCEECSKEGTHELVGISGQIEYYCTEHYNKLIEFMNRLYGN